MSFLSWDGRWPKGVCLRKQRAFISRPRPPSQLFGGYSRNWKSQLWSQFRENISQLTWGRCSLPSWATALVWPIWSCLRWGSSLKVYMSPLYLTSNQALGDELVNLQHSLGNLGSWKPWVTLIDPGRICKLRRSIHMLKIFNSVFFHSPLTSE